MRDFINKITKKSRKLLVIIISIIAVILTIAGGYTYSKYRSKVTGNANIQIAEWIFDVNGAEETMNQISLGETANNKYLKEHTIGPGTKGAFSLVLNVGENQEAWATYLIKFENETQPKPENLVFSCDGTEVSTLKELEPLLTGIISPETAENGKLIKTISWEWKYETGTTVEEIRENDEADTKIGKNVENYGFDVIVIGTQVDPTI